MAEANTTDPVCSKNSKDKSNHNQNTESGMNIQLPSQEVSSVPAQSKIKTDYLENLLDLPKGLGKENLKDKVFPQDPVYVRSSSSSENEEVDIQQKVQNTGMPSIPMNNIAEESVRSENRDNGISLTSANILETMEVSGIQNSSNTTGNTFDSPNNEIHMNNIPANTSLQLICDYGSDSDDCDIMPQSSNIIAASQANEKDFLNDYRTADVLFSEDSEDDSDSSDDKSDSDSSSSTSSSSSSSSSSVIVENASANGRETVNNAKNNASKPKKKKNALMTKGEISLEDLPPIEDLYITVPEEECMELGKIVNIVEPLVIVQANKNTPPLDIDSVLFLDKGKKTLGQIYDVFGQVSEPLYCVRFNSADHIKTREVDKDMVVYCAPRTKHTTYVFMPHLLKMKGSDASWKDNNEPPPKFLDYSDDEEERRARRELNKSSEKKVTDDGADQPKKKKTRSNSFERRMNERNLRMTALHANRPPATPIRNNAPHSNNNNSNNNNSVPRPPFDRSAWWANPMPHNFHRPARPPTRTYTPSPQRLIQPPTFTLPPPRFDIPPYPVFSSPPPPPPAFSSPHGASNTGPGVPPVFSPFQAPPFLPFNHRFPPPIPPFDPNRPPPSFGFPPSFPPQIPRHRPPPPP